MAWAGRAATSLLAYPNLSSSFSTAVQATAPRRSRRPGSKAAPTAAPPCLRMSLSSTEVSAHMRRGSGQLYRLCFSTHTWTACLRLCCLACCGHVGRLRSTCCDRIRLRSRRWRCGPGSGMSVRAARASTPATTLRAERTRRRTDSHRRSEAWLGCRFCWSQLLSFTPAAACLSACNCCSITTVIRSHTKCNPLDCYSSASQ